MFRKTIECAVQKSGMSEKELARLLNTTQRQLSKWKLGHPIPAKSLKQLKTVCFPKPANFNWEVFIGSTHVNKAWQKYMMLLHDSSESRGIELLRKDQALCISKIMNLFIELEIVIPQHSPPDEKQFESEEYQYSHFDSVVRHYFESHSFLSLWCQYKLPYGEEFIDYYFEIEDLIVDFAISHVEGYVLALNGFNEIAFKTNNHIKYHQLITCISSMCDKMRQLNKPSATDYFELVNDSLDDFADKIYGPGSILQETG